jgi:hypothetical protein
MRASIVTMAVIVVVHVSVAADAAYGCLRGTSGI